MNRRVENKVASRQLIFGIATALIGPGIFTVFTMITKSPVAESFAAVVAVTLITPPLISECNRLRDRLLIAGAAIVSVTPGLLWMPVTGSQSLNCILIAASFVMLIVGIMSLCRSVWENAFVISMGITIGLLLWLSWPIWLSERLAGHKAWVNALAAGHPLLAINGQLLDQAIWTERPLMYAWTALNQDVSFAIPTTMFRCVFIHGGIGGLVLALSLLIDRYRRVGSVVGS